MSGRGEGGVADTSLEIDTPTYASWHTIINRETLKTSDIGTRSSRKIPATIF